MGLGRIVHNLNSPVWNATGQPSGTYLERAVKGEKVLMKKVVLVK